MADIELPAIYIPNTFLEVVTSVTGGIVEELPSSTPSSVVSVESVDEAVVNS